MNFAYIFSIFIILCYTNFFSKREISVQILYLIIIVILKCLSWEGDSAEWQVASITTLQ